MHARKEAISETATSCNSVWESDRETISPAANFWLNNINNILERPLGLLMCHRVNDYFVVIQVLLHQTSHVQSKCLPGPKIMSLSS